MLAFILFAKLNARVAIVLRSGELVVISGLSLKN
jgi:hypothetical protein